jgi:NADH dehydrogenase
MAQICVLGGTGFIGRHLLNHLVTRAHRVRVPTRRLAHARDLYPLPTVDFLQADIHDDAALARLVNGCDAVVNLAGILHSRAAKAGAPYGADFARVHAELPRRLADACARAGVEQIVQVSALGASGSAPSEYLRSKAAGEEALAAAIAEASRNPYEVSSNLNFTVFRPSAVFGREDRFLNLFVHLQRVFPVVILPCPDARFQPVYVEDVARCIDRALLNPETYGNTYEVCGPKVYTLRELVEYAGRVSGHARPVLGLSQRMSELQGAMMELVPGKLMTRDNVRSMSIDSVCAAPFPFGLEPEGLEAVAPEWLCAGPRTRMYGWRAKAGR